MKTSSEILNKKFGESTETSMDMFKGNGLKLILEAMDEYALQFIHPSKCYQCDGEGKITLPSLVRMDCMICNGTGKLIILPIQKNT